MKDLSALTILNARNRKPRLGFLALAAALLALSVFTVLQRTANSQEERDSNDQPFEIDAGWTATGNLITARTGHTATLLANGKVLVAGGETPSGSGTALTATAEIYDPATGIWTSTGNLIVARARHTATLLSNGRVVVVSGSNGTGSTNSVEIYDPATGLWTSAGSVNVTRQGHTASLLPNGKLLVAGGVFGGTALSELYDPTTGTSAFTGSFVIAARVNHTATTLANGGVLVAGGNGLGGPFNTAEIYDIPTGNWNLTSSMVNARDLHATSLLPNGKVLVSGGSSASPNSCELFDPVAGTWSGTGSMNSGRFEHTSTLLANGSVIVTGGQNSVSGQVPQATELYNPLLEAWTVAGNLNSARYQHTATLLPNGRVLVVGGRNGSTFSNILNSCELYDPTPTGTPTPTPNPSPTPTPPGSCLVNPVVDTSADSGLGSLRAAVTSACAGSTITFSGSVMNPIRLESDSIVITKSLTIEGPSSRRVTISGSNFFRVFSVSGPISVTIRRLTITEGRRTSGGGSAIVNFNGSSLELDECTVAGNTGGSGLGGAISNFEATLNILNSTVSNNRGGSRGAGIGSSGTLTVANSTISGNYLQDFGDGGGGIYVGSGVASVVNSTITDNGTLSMSAIASRGGGIFNDRGTVSVRNTIIAGNGDLGPASPAPDVFGSFVSHGYNLIGQNDGSTGFPIGNPNAALDIVGSGVLRSQPDAGAARSKWWFDANPCIARGQPGDR